MRTSQPQPLPYSKGAYKTAGQRGYRPSLPIDLGYYEGEDAARIEERDAISALLWHFRTMHQEVAEALKHLDYEMLDPMDYVRVQDLGDAVYDSVNSVLDKSGLESIVEEQVRKLKEGPRGVPGPIGNPGPSGENTPRFIELEEKIADLIEMIEDLD